MQAKYITYQETNAFSPIVLDYIGGAPQLNSFYAYKADLAGFDQAIKNRSFSGSRKDLVEVLQQQYTGIERSALTTANISALLDQNTFTITTGHQLNIFTGPLYFIYKIVTAINLAKDLKIAFPEQHFVPVYWMATEDHDFEEINNIKVEDKKLTWEKNAAGATGRLDTKDIIDTLIAYKGYLGITENGLRLAQMVEDAYTKHAKLSDATRALVNALFGRFGLVCVDADEPILKQQFADIVYQDITGTHSSENIAKTNADLEQLGYKPQVNPREINFFYMVDGLRERIVFEGGKYQVMHSEISFSESSLKEEIEQHPERFSPNVVMRPLYQEVILPNIAYIGGGAEVTYWLQLKSNFDHYKVPFPIVMLRNSAQVIDKRSAERMHILGINHKDIFSDDNTLQQNWIKAHVNLQFALDNEERAVRAIFDQIKLNAYKIDKSLSQSADAARTKALKLIGNLEKKMMRAEKRKHKTSLAQIESLKSKLFPNGGLQERSLNIAPMYILHGDDFIDSLVNSFKPLDYQFTILFG